MKLSLKASRPNTGIIEGIAAEPYAFMNLEFNPKLFINPNESWFTRNGGGRWGFGLSIKQENVVTFDGYFSLDLSKKSLHSLDPKLGFQEL